MGVLETAEGLLAVPSENPPGDEAAAVAWVRDRLETAAIDWTVTTQPVVDGRANIIARAGDPDRGRVVLNGHLDVVPADAELWHTPPYTPTVRDGRLVARGSADMKGAIAAQIEAAEAFLARADSPGEVMLVFVVDEEYDGRGARRFVEEPLTADIVVIGEPTELDILTAVKGVARYRLTLSGRPCHSGTPDRGVDAIRGLATVIERIGAMDAALATTSHAVLAHEDITVTEVDAGVAPNTVAGEAHCTIDWRVLPGETDPAGYDARLTEALADISVDGQALAVDLERIVFARGAETAHDHPAVTAAAEAIRSVGAPGRVGGLNGATDSRFFINDLDLPTIHFGPGSIADDAHTVDESVAIADLDLAQAAYEAVLEAFLTRA